MPYNGQIVFFIPNSSYMNYKNSKNGRVGWLSFLPGKGNGGAFCALNGSILQENRVEL
jgi:hypothetical protein